jgi:hypothetical protein
VVRQEGFAEVGENRSQGGKGSRMGGWSCSPLRIYEPVAEAVTYRSLDKESPASAIVHQSGRNSSRFYLRTVTAFVVAFVLQVV